jgi:bilirubin oxidase
MMAAFNVSSLGDWGYPETTHFIDPMEEKWRSRDENDHDFEEEHIYEKLYDFYMLDAYKDVDKVEDALVSYWNAGGPNSVPKTTATPSTLTTSTKPVTTPAPTATSTKKDDKSGKNTTKK